MVVRKPRSRTFFFLVNYLPLYVLGFYLYNLCCNMLRCSTWACHCGGFSCCRAWVLNAGASAFSAHRLQSVGSVILVHWLSCSAACRIFPDQGLNPLSPALAGRLISIAPPGKSQSDHIELITLRDREEEKRMLFK